MIKEGSNMQLSLSNKLLTGFLGSISIILAIYSTSIPFLYVAILFIFLMVVSISLSIEKPSWYFFLPALFIYQIYVPIGFSITSLVVLLFILFAKEVINNNILWYFKNQYSFKLYSLMIIVMTSAIIYSPNRFLGVKLVYFSLVGLLSLCLGYIFIRKKLSVSKILNSLIIFGLPLATLNIIFLLLPDLELDFLNSGIASLFIDPTTLRMLNNGDISNNILDPYKAGTFFINTNIASVYFGFFFCISFSQMLSKWKWRYVICTVLFCGAILATQSRAGLLALIIVVPIFILLKFSVKSLVRLLLLVSTLATIIFSIMPASILNNLTSRLNINAVENDPRVLIWEFTLQKMIEHPFLGLGFGGWDAEFPGYAIRMGLDPSFPPHNIFVIVWTWAGLPCLLLFVLFMINSLVKILRKYLIDKNIFHLSGVGCVIFVVIQGMFDNFFLHNYSISTLFFFLMGLLLYEEKSEVKKPSEIRSA
ncbi:O-antigen ligase family protein [Paenibacillus shunpengii]|uniref:O-antigen ligase family protein n=1 Tax=Paenibacillus shunpengii TaxID=2054424 RepID=A0ABW5SHX9_9BACL